jgi:hypothetical protein
VCAEPDASEDSTRGGRGPRLLESVPGSTLHQHTTCHITAPIEGLEDDQRLLIPFRILAPALVGGTYELFPMSISRMSTDVTVTSRCVFMCLLTYCVCLLLQYLLQSCSRGGRGIVEGMCYKRRRAEALVD